MYKNLDEDKFGNNLFHNYMENITNNSNPFLYKNVLFNENNLNQNYMDQITDDKNKGIYENSLSIKTLREIVT